MHRISIMGRTKSEPKHIEHYVRYDKPEYLVVDKESSKPHKLVAYSNGPYNRQKFEIKNVKDIPPECKKLTVDYTDVRVENGKLYIEVWNNEEHESEKVEIKLTDVLKAEDIYNRNVQKRCSHNEIELINVRQMFCKNPKTGGMRRYYSSTFQCMDCYKRSTGEGKGTVKNWETLYAHRAVYIRGDDNKCVNKITGEKRSFNDICKSVLDTN